MAKLLFLILLFKAYSLLKFENKYVKKFSLRGKDHVVFLHSENFFTCDNFTLEWIRFKSVETNDLSFMIELNGYICDPGELTVTGLYTEIDEYYSFVYDEYPIVSLCKNGKVACKKRGFEFYGINYVAHYARKNTHLYGVYCAVEKKEYHLDRLFKTGDVKVRFNNSCKLESFPLDETNTLNLCDQNGAFICKSEPNVFYLGKYHFVVKIHISSIYDTARFKCKRNGKEYVLVINSAARPPFTIASHDCSMFKNDYDVYETQNHYLCDEDGFLMCKEIREIEGRKYAIDRLKRVKKKKPKDETIVVFSCMANRTEKIKMLIRPDGFEVKKPKSYTCNEDHVTAALSSQPVQLCSSDGVFICLKCLLKGYEATGMQFFWEDKQPTEFVNYQQRLNFRCPKERPIKNTEESLKCVDGSLDPKPSCEYLQLGKHKYVVDPEKIIQNNKDHVLVEVSCPNERDVKITVNISAQDSFEVVEPKSHFCSKSEVNDALLQTLIQFCNKDGFFVCWTCPLKEHEEKGLQFYSDGEKISEFALKGQTLEFRCPESILRKYPEDTLTCINGRLYPYPTCLPRVARVS